MTKLYSLKEVSEILDISDTSLYKLLSLDKPENAKIKSFTIGRGRKIESDEVERFIEETRESGGVDLSEVWRSDKELSILEQRRI